MSLPPFSVGRSTFCYVNTSKFLSKQDLIDNQRNWETFERVENTNSIVRQQLANTVPNSVTSGGERVWYQFTDNEERIAYKLGQFAHIAKYPDVSDFLVPYSDRPIQYTSSVTSSIAKLLPNECVDCACPKPILGKPITDEERLKNIKAANLYVKVSTQTGLYPKSPYHYGSAEEYLLYKRYVSMNNVNPV